MINTLCLQDSQFIDNRCQDSFFMTQQLATLCIIYMYDQLVFHVVVKALLCFPYYFLMSNICIMHSIQVYIAINTILYLYTLLIDSISHSYSSLCLSCNLSQAKVVTCTVEYSTHLLLKFIGTYNFISKIHFSYSL